ncbi:odorant receptor 45a-like [Bactrocera neohumeralis]|uniref:odorant receptor 45a-like n=1 Tax=Bactrocera neohumeralis TaxID=98809 RepID=UPI002166B3EB|nr:odorant receptor 45a-like [Bactrocera neohumeralis]
MYEYLRIQHFSFRVIGIDLWAQRDQRIASAPCRYYSWTLATAIITLLMGFYIYTSEQDKAIRVLTVFLQGVLSVIKSGMFVAKGRRFIKLIRSLDMLAAEANVKEGKEWKHENDWQQRIARVYYSCCMSTGTLYCTVPAVILLYSWCFNEHTIFILPFDAAFPFDTGHPFFYTVSYIWCISFIIYAVHAIAAMDSLFCWFIFNISAHFRALQRAVETVGAAMTGEEDYASLHSRITRTLHYHRRIIELSAEFDELYAPIVFIEISVSYLKLCFSAYNLINLGDISGLPVIAVGLITITFQLCIYCFSGEKIKNVSEAVSDRIYLAFPWERVPPSVRRLLLLPLMRAQRATNLTGFLFIVDHSLLVWIFKTTGSIIGFLSATKSENTTSYTI